MFTVWIYWSGKAYLKLVVKFMLHGIITSGEGIFTNAIDLLPCRFPWLKSLHFIIENFPDRKLADLNCFLHFLSLFFFLKIKTILDCQKQDHVLTSPRVDLIQEFYCIICT